MKKHSIPVSTDPISPNYVLAKMKDELLQTGFTCVSTHRDIRRGTGYETSVWFNLSATGTEHKHIVLLSYHLMGKLHWSKLMKEEK